MLPGKAYRRRSWRPPVRGKDLREQIDRDGVLVDNDSPPRSDDDDDEDAREQALKRNVEVVPEDLKQRPAAKFMDTTEQVASSSGSDTDEIGEPDNSRDKAMDLSRGMSYLSMSNEKRVHAAAAGKPMHKGKRVPVEDAPREPPRRQPLRRPPPRSRIKELRNKALLKKLIAAEEAFEAEETAAPSPPPMMDEDDDDVGFVDGSEEEEEKEDEIPHGKGKGKGKKFGGLRPAGAVVSEEKRLETVKTYLENAVVFIHAGSHGDMFVPRMHAGLIQSYGSANGDRPNKDPIITIMTDEEKSQLRDMTVSLLREEFDVAFEDRETGRIIFSFNPDKRGPPPKGKFHLAAAREFYVEVLPNGQFLTSGAGLPAAPFHNILAAHACHVSSKAMTTSLGPAWTFCTQFMWGAGPTCREFMNSVMAQLETLCRDRLLNRQLVLYQTTVSNRRRPANVGVTRPIVRVGVHDEHGLPRLVLGFADSKKMTSTLTTFSLVRLLDSHASEEAELHFDVNESEDEAEEEKHVDRDADSDGFIDEEDMPSYSLRKRSDKKELDPERPRFFVDLTEVLRCMAPSYYGPPATWINEEGVVGKPMTADTRESAIAMVNKVLDGLQWGMFRKDDAITMAEYNNLIFVYMQNGGDKWRIMKDPKTDATHHLPKQLIRHAESLLEKARMRGYDGPEQTLHNYGHTILTNMLLSSPETNCLLLFSRERVPGAGGGGDSVEFTYKLAGCAQVAREHPTPIFTYVDYVASTMKCYNVQPDLTRFKPASVGMLVVSFLIRMAREVHASTHVKLENAALDRGAEIYMLSAEACGLTSVMNPHDSTMLFNVDFNNIPDNHTNGSLNYIFS